MATTKIEWTRDPVTGKAGVTWNPVTGCDRISPGCDHCYALTMAGRLKLMGQPKYQADGDPRTSGPGFAVTCHPDELQRPLTWRKPRMVFVNSMSDLFHGAAIVARADGTIPTKSLKEGGWGFDSIFLHRVFQTMAATPQHTYQVLTKRPQLMAMWFQAAAGPPGYALWPLPNVWLGTSIESDRYTFRADHLRATPAAVRFLSLEPLLGPLPSLDLTGIDWVIVGGESGRDARPMHPAWVRDIRDRCVEAGVRFFFKQWGEWLGFGPDEYGASLALAAETGSVHKDWLDEPQRSASVRVGKKRAGRELDGRTWDEMPEPWRYHNGRGWLSPAEARGLTP